MTDKTEKTATAHADEGSNKNSEPAPLWVTVLQKLRLIRKYVPEKKPEAISIWEVISQELELIRQKRLFRRYPNKRQAGVTGRQTNSQGEKAGKRAAPGPEVLKKSWRSGLWGLAFSGGGIRSATFNLGILQALARQGLLKRVDLLSTVSGGGYIGSWLNALLYRISNQENQHNKSPVNTAEDILSGRDLTGIASDNTVPDQSSNSLHNQEYSENPHLRFLRQFSNYLTPRYGFFTADTWSAIITYVRNLLLNLIVLLPLISAVLLIIHLLNSLFYKIINSSWEPTGISALWAGSLVILLLAAFTVGRNFGFIQHSSEQAQPNSDDQIKLQWLFVLPMFGLSIIGCVALFQTAALHTQPLLYWIISGALIHGLFWCVAGITTWATRFRTHNDETNKNVLVSRWWRTWLRILLSALLSGAIAGIGLYWVGTLFVDSSSTQVRPLIIQLVFGPPLLMVIGYLSSVLFTGFMGRTLGEPQREWLSRLGAWGMIYAVVWVLINGLVLAGPFLIAASHNPLKAGLLTGWLATIIGGALAGRSSDKDGWTKAVKLSLIKFAPYVLIIGLIAGLSSALYHGTLNTAAVTSADIKSEQVEHKYSAFISSLSGITVAENSEAKKTQKTALTTRLQTAWHNYIATYDLSDRPFNILAWLVALLLISLFMARVLDVNDFSMHHFYSNRLVRCYLGATVPRKIRRKQVQPFTGFSESDDIPLHAVDGFKDCANNKESTQIAVHDGPLHIINCALNLVAGEELAWQERNAASFFMTPLHCGFHPFENQANDSAINDVISDNGFRPTDEYASQRSKLVKWVLESKITLGNALATSGAAFTSNMGAYTTPAAAFLMTLFNIRLGRWIGNPRHRKSWQFTSPRFAPWTLIQELLGLTKSDTPYVYLSDGGHFDNLGVYELVRRRCRFIVVCDAGADPDFEFADLSNVIRKVRADFGVDIHIDTRELIPDENGLVTNHCAIGHIHYPPDGEDASNQEHDESKVGTLLYIKPSLLGNEPEDIKGYAKSSPQFPHETTIDQFFSESQFESYRRLGIKVGETVFEKAINQLTCDRNEDIQKLSLERLFSLLHMQWFASSPHTSKHFTRHTQRFHEMMDQLSQDDSLSFLMPQLYPEWRMFEFAPANTVPATIAPHQQDFQAAQLWSPEHCSEDQFKAAFCFCNGMIQLMEDVYLDLNLECEFDHPDNRGWINLFKHWSWSSMFRLTWSICASMYGYRFQLFCDHRLDIKLGNLSAGSIDLNAIDSHTGHTLNFLEIEQLKSLSKIWENAGIDNNKVRLYQLNMVVPKLLESSTGDGLVNYSFGYAALYDNHVIAFRVQDHLRKMGLARKGLESILKYENQSRDTDFDDISTVKWGKPFKPDTDYNGQYKGDLLSETFKQEDCQRFIRLFYSVREQLVAQKQADNVI